MKKNKQFKQLNKALEQLIKLAEVTQQIQNRQPHPTGFAKGGIISGSVTCKEPTIPEHLKAKLSIEYLLTKHPFLTKEQAESLYNFCVGNTITIKTCYGDGRVMLHKWIDYKLENHPIINE